MSRADHPIHDAITSGRRRARRRERLPRTLAAATLVLALVLLAGGSALGLQRATPVPSPAPDSTTIVPLASLVAPLGSAAPFQESVELPGGLGLFGASVALSADGRTAVVGGPLEGPGDGAAFVFVRTPSGWQEQARLGAGATATAKPSAAGEGGESCTEGEECRLGISVAISADGNTVMIGAPREEAENGAAWSYTRSGTSWTQFGPELRGDWLHGRTLFGRSVALSADGETALIGAPARSSAELLRRSGSGWEQVGAPLGSTAKSSFGRFGRSVALSADGEVAFVGAPGDESGSGSVWPFADEHGVWHQQGPALRGGPEESAGGRFGSSIALSPDGGQALIGAPGNKEFLGAVFALVRSGETWIRQGPLLSGHEEFGPSRFGQSVALAGDGEHALVGGPSDYEHAGAVWAFARSGTQWSALAKIVPPPAAGPAEFGSGVALSADALTALIGAPAQPGLPGSAWVLSEPPAPSVASVEPAEGPSTGGTKVTITGSGFRPGASVRIGSAATSVDVVSEDEITAVTVGAHPGGYEVQVTDAGGSSTVGPTFTYAEPPPEEEDEEQEEHETESTPSTETTTTPPPTTPTTTSTPTTPTPTPKGGVLSAKASSTVPPPVLDVRGNVAPVSGLIRIRLPGSHGFTTVHGLTEVPFGTLIDASGGTVTVTTATGTTGATQSIDFYQGQFRLTQTPGGQTVATLAGGNERSCPRPHRRTRPADITASHTVRKLWANGHGKYATKGHYAAGAVLGTRWVTEDLCGATLIHVLTDEVAVTDFVKHRRVIVKAGHSYLARAR